MDSMSPTPRSMLFSLDWSHLCNFQVPSLVALVGYAGLLRLLVLHVVEFGIFEDSRCSVELEFID